MKTGPDSHSIAIVNESESVKHENGPDALGTAEPEWKHKTWKLNTASSVPRKMTSEAQNMKTGPDALCTVKNESESANIENLTWLLLYLRKTW
jgi:hypothetical protein